MATLNFTSEEVKLLNDAIKTKIDASTGRDKKVYEELRTTFRYQVTRSSLESFQDETREKFRKAGINARQDASKICKAFSKAFSMV